MPVCVGQCGRCLALCTYTEYVHIVCGCAQPYYSLDLCTWSCSNLTSVRQLDLISHWQKHAFLTPYMVQDLQEEGNGHQHIMNNWFFKCSVFTVHQLSIMKLWFLQIFVIFEKNIKTLKGTQFRFLSSQFKVIPSAFCDLAFFPLISSEYKYMFLHCWFRSNDFFKIFEPFG